MRKLDFVSVAPQFTIFKKGANKTNFGGVIFLIYIIILLILALIYLFDYFEKDRYEYNYTYNKKTHDEWSTTDDEHLNIVLGFSVYLSRTTSNGFVSLQDNPNFKVIDVERFTEKYMKQASQGILDYLFTEDDDIIIHYGQLYMKKLKDIRLAVIYKCNGGRYETDCYIREEDKLSVDQMYYFGLGYAGYNIDHQNPEKPLFCLSDYVTEDNKIDIRYKSFKFFETTNLIYLNWEKIEYEEKKEFLEEHMIELLEIIIHIIVEKLNRLIYILMMAI